jgi:hypothetical protein
VPNIADPGWPPTILWKCEDFLEEGEAIGPAWIEGQPMFEGKWVTRAEVEIEAEKHDAKIIEE